MESRVPTGCGCHAARILGRGIKSLLKHLVLQGFFFFFKNEIRKWAGEMAQQKEVLATKASKPSLVLEPRAEREN